MFTLLQARLQWYINQELPDAQAGFRKGRGIWDQIVNICWVIKKKQGNSRKKCIFCFIDYTKAFDGVSHNKLWKILKEMGIPATPYLSPKKIYMQVKKQQLKSGMEWQTGSKLGKEYVKAVYCHPTYLTYIQSISCEMPGCMAHKLESRLLREIATTWDM